MKFEFARNKYSKELLIDCFHKKGEIDATTRAAPFQVSFYEIIVILGGKGMFKLAGEPIPYERGTILLLPPNKWREWVSMESDFEAIYLLFEEESISTFFQDALYLYRLHYFHNINCPPFISLSEPELLKLLSPLQELQEELREVRSDSSHLLRSILYYLLITINRAYEASYELAAEFYHKTEVLQFKQLLEQHIKQYHKVSDYAQLLGISNSHLNKLLQTHFGKSCSHIIKDRLIIEIKRQLLFSQKTISEICYELNFSEPSNFVRFSKAGYN